MSTEATTDTVIELLLSQHARIEELFQLVETSTGPARQQAFEELARLLQVHETAEAELVHPLSAQSIDEGAEVVDARLEEEEEAAEALSVLVRLGTAGAEFDDLLQQLRLAVLEHAAREERYEFKQLRAAQPYDVLTQLADDVRALQDELYERL